MEGFLQSELDTGGIQQPGRSLFFSQKPHIDGTSSSIACAFMKNCMIYKHNMYHLYFSYSTSLRGNQGVVPTFFFSSVLEKQMKQNQPRQQQTPESTVNTPYKSEPSWWWLLKRHSQWLGNEEQLTGRGPSAGSFMGKGAFPRLEMVKLQKELRRAWHRLAVLGEHDRITLSSFAVISLRAETGVLANITYHSCHYSFTRDELSFLTIYKI